MLDTHFILLVVNSRRICGRGRITAPGRFLGYTFQEVCEFFKVPHIGLVKVERLGQRLNVPTKVGRGSDRNKALLTYGDGIGSPALDVLMHRSFEPPTPPRPRHGGDIHSV